METEELFLEISYRVRIGSSGLIKFSPNTFEKGSKIKENLFDSNKLFKLFTLNENDRSRLAFVNVRCI